MKYECAKCKENADGWVLVEEGTAYIFCKSCSDIINELNRTGIIHDFIGHKEETCVSKNIRQAKERRDNGKGHWQTYTNK